MAVDPRGPLEARLLALERRLVHADDQLRQQQRELIGVGQSLWDAWGDRRIPTATPTPSPTPTPNTTVTGTVKLCNSTVNGTGLAVTLTRDSDSALLDSQTTNGSGNYTFNYYQATATAVHVNASSPPANYVSGSLGLTASVGSNIASTLTLGAASGYTCSTGACGAMPSTLTLTVTAICPGNLTRPSDTLTYQARPAWIGSSFGANGWLGATGYTVAPLGAGATTYYWFVLGVSGAAYALYEFNTDSSGERLVVWTNAQVTCAPFGCGKTCGDGSGTPMTFTIS